MSDAVVDPGFERRNRARISVLVVLATINYIIAVTIAAVVVTLVFVLTAVFKLEIIPSDATEAKWIGIGIGAILAVSAVVGFLAALVRIPGQRRSLEKKVMAETGARIAEPDDHREVQNLLEGLAIAAGIQPPRFAILDDAAPNSFGVGTRPKNTIIAVTTGLIDKLSRDEPEAILAYEVSRIDGWDIALCSWTVALTAGAISALDTDDARAIFGFFSIRASQRLQVWALDGQGELRDRHAVQFTRNPKSLVDALQKLHDDKTVVQKVSRATAPLWIEFPSSLAAASTNKAGKRLANELLLDERIASLREMAGFPPDTAASAPTTAPS